jgi:hypothetical protein
MTASTVPPPVSDEKTLALLRNDLRGLTREAIGELVAELTRRMGIDPSLAPIDLIPDRGGALRLYINARGASELDKQNELDDADLDVDIRERPPVVIVKVRKVDPRTGRSKRNVGASAYDPEKPDTLARAIKQATTSGHRRTTLAMVGVFIAEPESWDAVRDA